MGCEAGKILVGRAKIKFPEFKADPGNEINLLISRYANSYT